MWNLMTSRPIIETRGPHRWATAAEPMEIVYNKDIIVAPVVGVLSSAPKPPKKRFLEAAAAAQQQKLQGELVLEHEEVIQVKTGGRAGPTTAPCEDNSALMQLAEMCVYYQKSGQPASWRRESPVYTLSPANTPFWGWSNRSADEHHRLHCQQEQDEEPLDLSGEETIRTNQQELIDHLVEKLCARPLSGSIQSALVQPKLSLLINNDDEKPSIGTLLGHHQHYSSSEVSSSSPKATSMTTTTAASSPTTDVMRKDLPLKKRDSSLGLLVVVQQPDSTASSSSNSSNSSPSPPLPPVSSATGNDENNQQAVSSTNGTSKKPAPRSCKGKRYLEFMYEGRISVMGTTRITNSNSNKRSADTGVGETTNLASADQCDQSNTTATTGRKRRGAAQQARDSAVAATALTSLRAHRSTGKARKIS